MILTANIVISSGMGMGNPPCPPFSPCWCASHPTHPNCPPTPIPIDDYIIPMMLIGVLLAYTYLRPKKTI
jgi:hypothetical protein